MRGNTARGFVYNFSLTVQGRYWLFAKLRVSRGSNSRYTIGINCTKKWGQRSSGVLPQALSENAEFTWDSVCILPLFYGIENLRGVLTIYLIFMKSECLLKVLPYLMHAQTVGREAGGKPSGRGMSWLKDPEPSR